MKFSIFITNPFLCCESMDFAQAIYLQELARGNQNCFIMSLRTPLTKEEIEKEYASILNKNVSPDR
jgi:hypothetical protein